MVTPSDPLKTRLLEELSEAASGNDIDRVRELTEMLTEVIRIDLRLSGQLEPTSRQVPMVRSPKRLGRESEVASEETEMARRQAELRVLKSFERELRRRAREGSKFRQGDIVKSILHRTDVEETVASRLVDAIISDFLRMGLIEEQQKGWLEIAASSALIEELDAMRSHVRSQLG